MKGQILKSDNNETHTFFSALVGAACSLLSSGWARTRGLCQPQAENEHAAQALGSEGKLGELKPHPRRQFPHFARDQMLLLPSLL